MTVWLLILMLTTGQTVALDMESRERCEAIRASVNAGTGSVSVKVEDAYLRLPIAEHGGLMCITEDDFEGRKNGAGA